MNLETGIFKLVRTGSDLTCRQLAILFACRYEPRTVRKLAQLLAVSRPAISRAIDRLAYCGYAERQDDPSDRRSVLIVLTDAGRRFVSAFDTEMYRKAS